MKITILQALINKNKFIIMKFKTLKLSLFLSLVFLTFSCGSDDPEFDCGGNSCGSVLENLVGTWDVTSLGDNAGTVTFNADGTGKSSADGEFSRFYNGFDYNNFTWGASTNAEYDFEISYDFNLTNGPVFGITIRYNANLNECNCVDLFDGFSDSESSLKRR